MLSIGVIIPTYQAAKHLSFCLPPLIDSPLKPKILIIDSSSTDCTVALAKERGIEVIVIPQTEFDHGATREKARRYLNTDIVVMMTQDAYATSPLMLTHLVQPLIDQKSSISYARQLPHKGAGAIESFSRHFNYPSTSHIRRLSDQNIYGSYTFFCSNSCAAYLNSALDEIEGFPSVLFGEDTLVVAHLLQKNHSIAYVAEAEVHHSHHYSLKQEFQRHFDMGLARHEMAHLLMSAGKDTVRGKAFVKELMKKLARENPLLIPYAFCQIIAKLSGYTLGKYSVNASLSLKKFFSGYPSYWQNKINK